jgi:hypothetical protein
VALFLIVEDNNTPLLLESQKNSGGGRSDSDSNFIRKGIHCRPLPQKEKYRKIFLPWQELLEKWERLGTLNPFLGPALEAGGVYRFKLLLGPSDPRGMVYRSRSLLC